jgi:hypothetical protein
MNVRALAPSGNTGRDKQASQADKGRARASWGNKSISFSDSVDNSSGVNFPPISATKNKSNNGIAGGGSGGGDSSGDAGNQKTPGDGASSAANLEPSAVEFDQIDDEQGEENGTTEGYERIPGWQKSLLDIYRKLGGTDWKEQGGWPTANLMPHSQSVPNIEMYGVQRPFFRLSEVTVLDLAWNGLRGDIASCDGLWKLHSLEVLHLGANRISGPLPGYELRNLELLRELHL